MRTDTFGELTVRITGGTDGAGDGDGPIVVLLHGFGAPGTDLVGLSKVLKVTDGTRFVFPAAPLSFDMGFGDSRAWWMIDMMAYEKAMRTGTFREMGNEPPEGMAEARAAVLGMLDAVDEQLGKSPMVIGGFSQGAMLSLDVMLQSDRDFAALAFMSGSYANRKEWAPLFETRKGMPVFQSHGQMDPILPFEVAEEVRDEMIRGGFEHQWFPFAGAHEIPYPVTVELGSLISRVTR